MISRFNLVPPYLLVSLFFLPACTFQLNNVQNKIAKATFDSPPSVLLILDDNEIGKSRLDEFKELPIDIVYLGNADLSIVEQYEIVYLSADTFDTLGVGYLYLWRDSAKLIVGIDTQPTKLIDRLSVPAHMATPVDIDLNLPPENTFIASGYHQHKNGHGVTQNSYYTIFQLHRAMTVKQSNVHNGK